ncbi:hypothetical protein CSA37_05995 [Candidatus Fermentibacteria bacterium]|nr:MAG: hypothetical protein CSA37_05995 [Candidatus Fermentibacteria bacterium]
MNIGDIRCPSCGKAMKPVKLHCDSCELWLEGKFQSDLLFSLSSEDIALTIAFIRSYGSIKKLQEALGVSYPTARARLEKLVNKLNQTMEAALEQNTTLDRLDRGEISVDEALEEL